MSEGEWTEQAIDLLDELQPDVQQRILSKLDEVTEWTDHHLDKLSGYPYYKLRVGDYRVIVSWDREADVILVEAVGHRKNVYDRYLPP